MNTQTKRRGRPALNLDNYAIHDFFKQYDSLSELVDDYPAVESILTGAIWLQSEGQASTRPLSKGDLFHLLRLCRVISTESVQEHTRVALSTSQAHRYFMAARVASKAIADLLARSPKMVEHISLLKASREAVDAPYAEGLNVLERPTY